MMRFRERPAEVQAEQYQIGYQFDGLCECDRMEGESVHVHPYPEYKKVWVSAGDWIIRNHSGTIIDVIKDRDMSRLYERILE